MNLDVATHLIKTARYLRRQSITERQRSEARFYEEALERAQGEWRRAAEVEPMAVNFATAAKEDPTR